MYVDAFLHYSTEIIFLQCVIDPLHVQRTWWKMGCNVSSCAGQRPTVEGRVALCGSACGFRVFSAARIIRASISL